MPQAGRKQNDGRHILQHKSKTIKMTMTIVDRAYLMKKHRNEHYIMIKVVIDKEAAILIYMQKQEQQRA